MVGGMISMVPAIDLAKAWPHLWPLLEPAASRSDMTAHEVMLPILNGEAQLWAIRENGVPVAAVTTQITLQPERRCRLWLVGGSRMNEWAADFMTTIEPWARSLGCTAIWGTQSRKGWKRIVRLLGGEEFGLLNGIPAWGRRI